MNIYNLLSEEEKEKVNLYSQKVNTEKSAEPMFFKRQLTSDYILQLFRENHPEQVEMINRQQDKKNYLAQEHISKLDWKSNMYGWDGEKKSNER